MIVYNDTKKQFVNDVKQSEMTITYKPTGQVILFKGFDNPEKLTSIEVVYGFLTRTWSTTLLNELLIVIQIVKLHKGQRGDSRSPEKVNTMTG